MEINWLDKIFTASISSVFAFFAAYFAYRIQMARQDKKEKSKTTYDLYKEFNSGELLKSRTEADKIPKRYPDKTLDDLYALLNTEERTHIWHVIHFYQRLSAAVEYEQIEPKMVRKLFGYVFYWWYINCFEQQLVPIKWDASYQIENLNLWFERTSNKEDLYNWMARAQSYKQIDVAGDKRENIDKESIPEETRKIAASKENVLS